MCLRKHHPYSTHILNPIINGCKLVIPQGTVTTKLITATNVGKETESLMKINIVQPKYVWNYTELRKSKPLLTILGIHTKKLILNY